MATIFSRRRRVITFRQETGFPPFGRRHFQAHFLEGKKYEFIPKFHFYKRLLFQIMAWRRTGDKPISESMVAKFTAAYMRHSASGVKLGDHDFPLNLVVIMWAISCYRGPQYSVRGNKMYKYFTSLIAYSFVLQTLTQSYCTAVTVRICCYWGCAKGL